MSKPEKKEDLTDKLLKLQALREKVKQQEEAIQREEKRRLESESVFAQLQAETGAISQSLESEREKLRKYKELSDKLNSQKGDLEGKLGTIQRKLEGDESDKAALMEERKRAEEELIQLRKNLETIAGEMKNIKK